jgi:hypothetical protein
MLAETALVVLVALAVLQLLATEALAARVVPAAIVAMLLPVLQVAQAVSAASAQAAMAVALTEVMPRQLPFLWAAMGDLVVPVVPVVTQAPMVALEGQATEALAAMSPSPTTVP